MLRGLQELGPLVLRAEKEKPAKEEATEAETEVLVSSAQPEDEGGELWKRGEEELSQRHDVFLFRQDDVHWLDDHSVNYTRLFDRCQATFAGYDDYGGMHDHKFLMPRIFAEPVFHLYDLFVYGPASLTAGTIYEIFLRRALGYLEIPSRRVPSAAPALFQARLVRGFQNNEEHRCFVNAYATGECAASLPLDQKQLLHSRLCKTYACFFSSSDSG